MVKEQKICLDHFKIKNDHQKFLIGFFSLHFWIQQKWSNTNFQLFSGGKLLFFQGQDVIFLGARCYFFAINLTVLNLKKLKNISLLVVDIIK